MKSIYKYLLFVVSLFISWLSFGQSVLFHEFGVYKGAPADRVYSLAIDEDNYMYLGTEQGLFKYDGVNFSSIPLTKAISNSITDISFSKDHTLWSRSFSNQIFYLENNELHPLLTLEDLLEDEVVINFKIIGEILYVATYENVYIFKEEDHSFIKKIAYPALIEAIHATEEYLVVSMIDGRLVFIKELEEEFELTVNEGNYRITGSDTLFLVEKNLTINEIIQIDLKSRQIDVLSALPDELDRSALVNNIRRIDEAITLCTNKGTYMLYNGRWRTLNGLNNSDIVKDYQGGIWVSTIDNGLVYVPSIGVSFLIEADAGVYFRNIIPSPKGYLISTNEGRVIEITEKGEVIRVFDSNLVLELEFIYLDEKNDVLYTSIGTFSYSNPEQYKWFYYGKGLDIDKKGNVYYGTHDHTAVKKVDELAIYVSPEMLNKPIESNDYFGIRKMRTRDVIYVNDTLYSAQIDKLLLFDKNGEKELTTESGESIYGVNFYKDDEGNIWVATLLQGVFCFNNGVLVERFTANDGLSSNNCLNITGYKNEIYVSTDRGVCRIDKTTKSILDLSLEFSLDILQISSVLKMDDEKLFLISKKGVVVLENSVKNSSTPIILELSAVKNKFGVELTKLDKIKYEDRTIEISWRMLNYNFAEKAPIEYRLINFQDEWTQVSSMIDALTFNNLVHGNYEFEIRVGKDDRTLRRLAFSIQKPFWLRWWFIALVLVFGFFTILLTIRITKQEVQKRNRDKENLTLSQLTALHSQMNPHFLYNVLNSLQGLIYSKKITEAGNYLSVFSEHLRGTLEMSTKQWITIKDEIASLDLYLKLEKLRFGDEFNYEILKQDEVSDWAQIPSMVLQPFVENAVKHGLLNKEGLKRVDISFRLESDDYIYINIIDNGIGRERAEEINKLRRNKPESFATQAIETRIDLLNKHLKKVILLEITDGEMGIGTNVHIKIPIYETYESINS